MRLKTKPVTQYDTLLTFRDRDKRFELEGDFLQMTTIKNYNADIANLPDKKLRFEFAKEMYFNEKTPAEKKAKEISLLRGLSNHQLSGRGLSKRNLSQNRRSKVQEKKNDAI